MPQAQGKHRGVRDGRGRVPDDGALRVAPVVELPGVLRELGAEPAKVFAAAGVKLRLLDDPDNAIPYAAMGALLHASVEATGCDHVGLLVGMRSGSPVLGVLGYLVQHSPTVGVALDNLLRHLQVHDRGAVPTLEYHDASALFGYAIYQPDTPGVAQIYDGAIAIACNIMRGLCGPRWAPAEVLFSRRRPPDAGAYRRFFRCPLRFDAEQTALVFPSALLAQRMPNADAGLYRVLLQQVNVLESAAPLDLAGQLRRTLRSLVLTGRGSIEDVARTLGMHRRTLNRHLRTHRTTFRALRDEARHEVARQLLENTDRPVGEIAGMLDYADASAFTRAFVRWTRVPPAAWRASSRSRKVSARVSRSVKSGQAARGQ